MTHFQKVVAGLHPTVRDKLMHVFDKWKTCSVWKAGSAHIHSNHKRLISNLESEHFLDKDVYEELLNEIAIVDFKPMDEILEHILETINYKDYYLKGGRVIEQPSHFATAMTKERFENFLVKKMKFTDHEVKDMLNKQPEQYTDKQSDAMLKASQRLFWLTWVENSTDPYEFLSDITTETICDSMALDDDNRGKPMVLLYFTTEKISAILYRPTWCDSGLFDKFCPTDPTIESRWGQTMPDVYASLKAGYDRRRPEGIIRTENLKARSLSKRIQIINIR